jgi:hypothetical protein
MMTPAVCYFTEDERRTARARRPGTGAELCRIRVVAGTHGGRPFRRHSRSGDRTDGPVQSAGRAADDRLSLLEQKTRGNLSPEERQLLDQILYELRLRWVDAAGKGQASEPEQKSRIIIP